jgi:hypothetical protein
LSCRRAGVGCFGSGSAGNEAAVRVGALRGDRRIPLDRSRKPMLWTILIIVLIVALVLFILGRVRGR